MSSELAVSEQLSLFERGRLTELETVIERGLQTFAEVGLALLEIRDARLHRATYATFDDYCRERWGFTDRRGRQLMAAAEVGTIVPVANEAQARELVPLLRDEIAMLDVWRELRAEYGDEVTAERVRRLVHRRLERVEREQARAERLSSGESVHDDVDVRLGDFRAALADLDGVADAVVTDPPYVRAWLERDADDFAAAAARILKPSGTLVVLYGVQLHYDLKPRLDAALRYRWTGAYHMPGWSARIFAARLATNWKPLLIYARTDAPAFEFLTSDVVVSDAADKEHHDWGQSESGTEGLVERFTLPGELVVDPFLGGGTTALACHRLGRRFVGCDVDAAAIETTRRRLAA